MKITQVKEGARAAAGPPARALALAARHLYLHVPFCTGKCRLPLDARAFDRGCTGENSLATRRLTFVVGDAWVVQPETDDTARAIQAALGGRIEALACGQ